MTMTREDLNDLTAAVHAHLLDYEERRARFAEAEEERERFLAIADEGYWREAFRVSAADNVRLRLRLSELEDELRVVRERRDEDPL